MTIGEKIKRLREEKGMRQTELADKAGTTKQNIYKYENSIITNIPSDRLKALANALGVSPAIFFELPQKEIRVPSEHDTRIEKITEQLQQLTDEELTQAASYLDFLLSRREKQGTS